MSKITLKIDFNRRYEEIGSITRKEYLFHYLSKARNLVLSGEVSECLIDGYFYPNDIKAINDFVRENYNDVSIDYLSDSSSKFKGGHCIIQVKSL